MPGYQCDKNGCETAWTFKAIEGFTPKDETLLVCKIHAIQLRENGWNIEPV